MCRIRFPRSAELELIAGSLGVVNGQNMRRDAATRTGFHCPANSLPAGSGVNIDSSSRKSLRTRETKPIN